MSEQQWTFGGGPAERVEDYEGQFRQGLHLFVRSSVTGNLADINIETGPNGRIPTFYLPREWEWSSVSVSPDDMSIYPLGQARELQQRPATVLRLQELISEQDTQITSQRVLIHTQEGQIGTLLTQMAASSSGTGLPDPVDPDSPDLPAPSDPETGDDMTDLPLPGDMPIPDGLPDFTNPTDDPSSLPLPEGIDS
ncbi:hypothetical protein [Brevibacterium aurantiacum]|uniref:hypothetical protein n=1 Tax=Brevibacterium aurantiacum TaxID=273384 RepID=UPI003F8DF514